ncbi:hypothetical protein [Streptomyces sp. SAI-127]|uniref:hypothetical protein n=1 Tax=Streptomyces sp. SAI-127 TaxID=2940543 RepID=UPI00247353A0|nr:hypothetical protein [Streptomyces sp. SAI-127]
MRVERAGRQRQGVQPGGACGDEGGITGGGGDPAVGEGLEHGVHVVPVEWHPHLAVVADQWAADLLSNIK